MGGKSDYLEKVILDLVLGGQAFTPPGIVYVTISTAAYDETSAITGEPAGGAFARVAVTNNLTSWPAATGASPAAKSNGITITFPTSTTAWGTILSGYVMDSATVGAGNKLYGGALDVARVMGAGDTASYPVGSFAATED